LAAAILAALLATMVALSGCSSTSTPISPSPPKPNDYIGLTVKVLEYSTYKPIIGAEVMVNGIRASSLTDNAGAVRVKVPLGVWIDVDVFAKGYVSDDAGGIVRSEEVWTFWLSRIGDVEVVASSH
jgi:hypothetical protein